MENNESRTLSKEELWEAMKTPIGVVIGDCLYCVHLTLDSEVDPCKSCIRSAVDFNRRTGWKWDGTSNQT